jgi:c-di-GMP phosphodiesterase
MRTVSHVYEDSEKFANFLNKNNVQKDLDNILVQVFTGRPEKKFIKKLSQIIISFLPKAKILGATTVGEICLNEVLEKQTVITITIFQKTKVETAAISHARGENQSHINGNKLAKKLITPETKALICFGEGISTNGEEFMKGIQEKNSNVVVGGGLAGDNMAMKQTYVFTEKK